MKLSKQLKFCIFFFEVKKATMAAYEHDGPVYLRLGTNREPEVYEMDNAFQVGKAVTVRDGKDVTLIGTGGILKDVLDVANPLEGVKVLSDIGFTCADFGLNSYLKNTSIYESELNDFFSQSISVIEQFFEPHKLGAEKAGIRRILLKHQKR